MDYFFNAHSTLYTKLNRDKKSEAEDVLLYENCFEEYPREATFVREYLLMIFRTKKDNPCLNELDYKGLLEAWYYYVDGETALQAIGMAHISMLDRENIV